MDRKWLKLFIQKNSTVQLVLSLAPLEKLFETPGRKKPFECRMYTWVYFWTKNFYILLGKMIFTSSYLKLLFLKTRNLALYYLYCLAYYLVEGPIERAACFALHCKKKWRFPLRTSPVNVTKPPFPADLVIFTEEILNGKLHFLWNVSSIKDGPCRGCSRMREGEKGPSALTSVTHILKWWNLAVIPYLKEIQK